MSWDPSIIINRSILVFGAGALGRRIACTWISGGFNVTVLDNFSQDGVEAIQYVVSNVTSYMKRIGSTHRGIIAVADSPNAFNASNPWLVIEAVPDLSTEEETTEFKTILLGELDAKLPEDCILCVDTIKQQGIFKNIQNLHRLLNLHHYLIPNVRIIEIVTGPHTNKAIVDFLLKVIPTVGAIPILAKDEPSAAGTFEKVWVELRQEVLHFLRKNGNPKLVDEGWEILLHHTTTDDIGVWFDNLSSAFNDALERSYMQGQSSEQPILSRLKTILSEEGKLAPFSPYDGLELEPYDLTAKLSRPVQRAGPSIFFVDIGCLDSSSNKHCRILCGCPDGTVRAIVTNLRLPYGLAIHHASKRIFWSDLAEGTISSCIVTGRLFRNIFPREDGPAPSKLAIDEGNSQIYWTQSEDTKILRCNLDGTSVECLLDTSETIARDSLISRLWPSGITLDTSRRLFYWSQPSLQDPTKYLIQRASMDLPSGSISLERKDIEVVFDNLPEILDIDFVPVFDELYWSIKQASTTEIHRGYVGSCNDFGMETQEIVVGDIKASGWVKVDPKGGHVYTTCLRGTLTRFDMNTGEGEYRMYKDTDGTFAGIALSYGQLDWEEEGQNVDIADIEVGGKEHANIVFRVRVDDELDQPSKEPEL